MAKGVSLRMEKLLEELVSAESVSPDPPGKEGDKARVTRLAATLRRTQTQTQTFKGSRTLTQPSADKGGEGKWQVVAGGARAANGKGKLASSRFYDSEVLVGYKQRYVREAFIHRVRTELERLKEADGKANVRPILANRELTKLTGQERRELRSLKSLNAYIKRKRALHQELVRPFLHALFTYIESSYVVSVRDIPPSHASPHLPLLLLSCLLPHSPLPSLSLPPHTGGRRARAQGPSPERVRRTHQDMGAHRGDR
jgi:hypothetical protein